MNERQIEETGPDVKTAISRGLARLKLRREDVIVDVIDSGSRGILGIGARPARVRILVREPDEDDYDDYDYEDDGESERVGAPEAAAPAAKAAVEAPAKLADDGAGRAAPAAVDEQADDGEDAEVGRAALEELLEKMGIDSKVHTYRAEPIEPNERTPWVLEIQGRDLGVLIGRRGETLDAVQYITRLIASRDLQRRVNIIVDVEGYKMRRAKQLQKLACRMADQAIQIDRTVELEPMTPYERRIVHITLRKRNDVTTQSVGEGERRRVTIIPS
jgi:spoIIIJ-associated protein